MQGGASEFLGTATALNFRDLEIIQLCLASASQIGAVRVSCVVGAGVVFRTSGPTATLLLTQKYWLGALELAGQAKALGGSVAARKRAASLVVKTVAGYLGNTPAVCRRSYLDPKVLDRFEDGETIAGDLRKLGEVDLSDGEVREAVELAVIDLLDGRDSGDLASASA
jgi:hypothetical protein